MDAKQSRTTAVAGSTLCLDYVAQEELVDRMHAHCDSNDCVSHSRNNVSEPDRSHVINAGVQKYVRHVREPRQHSEKTSRVMKKYAAERAHDGHDQDEEPCVEHLDQYDNEFVSEATENENRTGYPCEGPDDTEDSAD
jgi:hypothetical protein